MIKYLVQGSKKIDIIFVFKGKEQIRRNELREKEKLETEDVPSSKFKYVERGTQSRNGFRRNTETQTQGPARGLFSGTINRKMIY